MIIMYMTDFLIYDLKVALLVTIFYAFYRLLLSRDTWHRMNRVVLLGSAVLSFVLPLCIITTHVVETVEPLPALLPALPSVGEVKETVARQEHDAAWWVQQLSGIASWVVLLGMGVMLVRAVVDEVRLIRFVGRLEKHREEDGVLVAVSDEDVRPFSWMNTIVLDPAAYGHTKEELVAHLKQQGIDTRLLFVGMARQKSLRDYGCDCSGEYPVTDWLTANGFYLPSASSLTEEQIVYICQTIRDFAR